MNDFSLIDLTARPNAKGKARRKPLRSPAKFRMALPEFDKQPVRRAFMIVGRLHSSLTTSKAKPIVEAELFDEIFIFRELPGEMIDRVTYVTSPWLHKVPSILRRPIRAVWEPIQLLYYTLKYRPMVLNSYYLVPKGWYTLLISKLTRTPCVLSIIGYKGDLETHLWPTWFWKRVNLAVIKSAEACTTKGEIVNEYLRDHFVNTLAVFTYNGAIETNEFRPDSSCATDIDLLFVGHLDSRKGPDRFLDILEAVAAERGQIKAVLLGRGGMRDAIEKRISRLPENIEVRVAGYIQDTRSYYVRSKVFVLPSSSEGLSTAMLEAMSCGCVPVVSDVGCTADAIVGGENGFLVGDFNDTGAFARHASFLLANPELLEEMAKAGRQRVVERYSVAAQAECVREVFDFALNSKNGTAEAVAVQPD